MSEANYRFERGFPTAETVQRAYDAAGYCWAVQAYEFSGPDGTEITVMW